MNENEYQYRDCGKMPGMSSAASSLTFSALPHDLSGGQRRGLTAFVQGIGYLIAGVSPLLAGMIRDLSGSFEWAWWSLTAVMLVMMLMALRLNPRYYARHIT